MKTKSLMAAMSGIARALDPGKTESSESTEATGYACDCEVFKENAPDNYIIWHIEGDGWMSTSEGLCPHDAKYFHEKTGGNKVAFACDHFDHRKNRTGF